MKYAFIDSETCGLHGMPVLLQYAIDDGAIHLWDVWLRPVHETLALIENKFLPNCCVFFNASFDWFHLCKLYTIWRLLPGDWIPIEHINDIAMIEPDGQEGPCIKPASTLDLMLHARKTEFQALMARKPIRVRRVPTVLAGPLAMELEDRVQFDDIYFAKSANPDAPRWKVLDIDGTEEFKDVVLSFNAAGGLKYLAEHALGLEPKFHFKDVEPPVELRPFEYGYAPTALAVSTLEQGWRKQVGETKDGPVFKFAWPGVIEQTIEHWANNSDAREYARDDIVYTRGLFDYFKQPKHGDDDSVLACAVAAIRWRGYPIDVEGIRGRRIEAEKVVASSPVNLNRPSEIREYLSECLDDIEALVIGESCKKPILKQVSNYEIEEDEECSKCLGGGCHRCDFTGEVKAGPHPVVPRVKKILACKSKVKEVEVLSKLEHAGKFHASFRIIGTKSSRMSGADGLNAQGIKGDKTIRRMFKMKRPGEELSVGDFWSFEVTLAQAAYQDEKLKEDLITKVDCHKCDRDGSPCGECGGTGKTTKKLHALLAMCLFPGHTYEEIMASDGTDNDMYTKGKQGVFGGVFYGGDENTLVRNLGVKLEDAVRAIKEFGTRYEGVGKRRAEVTQMFSALRQPNGIGSAIYWHEPADYIDNGLGFKRYFTLENATMRALFNLARSVPKTWRDSDMKVVRRDRVQTAAGAVASALYGAAFGIQSMNIRAAANHEIQSKGAEICKYAQRRIWDLQPAGVHDFVVAPANVHDEIVTPVAPDHVDKVADIIRESIDHFRPVCPLLGIDWCKNAESWAEKKSGEMKIRPEGV